MINVLILGATGSIARVATEQLLQRKDVHLTLYVRNARRLRQDATGAARVVEGDVLDMKTLKAAMTGQDVVYANLAGDLAPMARNIAQAMEETGTRRLIWISSMGIYGEVPGERYRTVLDPYRDAAQIIEASNLEYTILRPGWFTDDDTLQYEVTRKGEPFRGHDISRKALATLIVKLATTPGLEGRQSLGVNQPVRSTR